MAAKYVARWHEVNERGEVGAREEYEGSWEDAREWLASACENYGQRVRESGDWRKSWHDFYKKAQQIRKYEEAYGHYGGAPGLQLAIFEKRFSFSFSDEQTSILVRLLDREALSLALPKSERAPVEEMYEAVRDAFRANEYDGAWKQGES